MQKAGCVSYSPVLIAPSPDTLGKAWLLVNTREQTQKKRSKNRGDIG